MYFQNVKLRLLIRLFDFLSDLTQNEVTKTVIFYREKTRSKTRILSSNYFVQFAVQVGPKVGIPGRGRARAQDLWSGILQKKK